MATALEGLLNRLPPGAAFQALLFSRPGLGGPLARWRTLAPETPNPFVEQVVAARYLLYRVLDGFAKGGILAFDIDRRKMGGCFLTIYVAFSFPKGRNPLTSLGWHIFGFVFPEFAHDVVWNHSLCKLKSLAEAEDV